MITGRKHVYCGKVNWEGKDECTCRPWGPVGKEGYQWVDVVFDNPELERIANIMRSVVEKMNLKGITFEFDASHENEDGEIIGCLIVDGWLFVYEEPLKFELLDGTTKLNPGFALDAMIVNYNYPNEPDDCDYARVAHASEFSIVRTVVEKLFAVRLDNVMEGMYLDSLVGPVEDLPF